MEPISTMLALYLAKIDLVEQVPRSRFTAPSAFLPQRLRINVENTEADFLLSPDAPSDRSSGRQ